MGDAPQGEEAAGEEAWQPSIVHRLLGAYYILRAFSWQLRLSPFKFQDLKQAVHLDRATALVKEIFVSLIRALAFGESKEERCQRRLPLDQVDYVTWTEYVVEWLELSDRVDLLAGTWRERVGKTDSSKGVANGQDAAGEVVRWHHQFERPRLHGVDRIELWTLPVHAKADIIGTLTDDLLMVPAIRNEINRRQILGPWSSLGTNTSDTISQDSRLSNAAADVKRAEELGVGEDGHVDECMLCSVGGNLVCCDGCPAAYHLRCVGEGAKALKEEMWLCPECRAGGRGEAAGIRIPVAGYGPLGTAFWSAGSQLVEGCENGIRMYAGQEALRELTETVNGRISDDMDLSKFKLLAVDDGTTAASSPDEYVNFYKGSWAPAMKGMEMFLQSIRSKPRKEKEAYGPLPLPLPISKFQWPQSMGRGQRRYLLRCGTCRHCLNPALHRACLKPNPKLVQGAQGSGGVVQTALSPGMFYILKLENEVWALLGGKWEGPSGLDHRRDWMAKVRSANTVKELARSFLELLEAVPCASAVLLSSWDPSWARSTRSKVQRASGLVPEVWTSAGVRTDVASKGDAAGGSAEQSQVKKEQLLDVQACLGDEGNGTKGGEQKEG